MEKPTHSAVREATGISQSYASMILSGARVPPRSLAVAIFRSTGWKHGSIADLTDEQISWSEQLDPWQPPAERAA